LANAFTCLYTITNLRVSMRRKNIDLHLDETFKVGGKYTVIVVILAEFRHQYFIYKNSF